MVTFEQERMNAYRRDAKRIALVLQEEYTITDINSFDQAYKDYMGNQRLNESFKGIVFDTIKRKKDFKTTVKRIEKPSKAKYRSVEYVFSGTQKGESKVQKAVFDRSVNRYRNEKGQFVKKL